MLDEFHRTTFKERALKAEGQRERGRENGRMVRRESCAERDIAVVCLRRQFLRRFPPKHSVISHEVGE